MMIEEYLLDLEVDEYIQFYLPIQIILNNRTMYVVGLDNDGLHIQYYRSPVTKKKWILTYSDTYENIGDYSLRKIIHSLKNNEYVTKTYESNQKKIKWDCLRP